MIYKYNIILEANVSYVYVISANEVHNNMIDKYLKLIDLCYKLALIFYCIY